MRRAATSATRRRPEATFLRNSEGGRFLVVQLFIIVLVQFQKGFRSGFEFPFRKATVAIRIDCGKKHGWGRRGRRVRIVAIVLFLAPFSFRRFGTEFLLAECAVLVLVEFPERTGGIPYLTFGKLMVAVLVECHRNGIRWRTRRPVLREGAE